MHDPVVLSLQTIPGLQQVEVPHCVVPAGQGWSVAMVQLSEPGVALLQI